MSNAATFRTRMAGAGRARSASFRARLDVQVLGDEPDAWAQWRSLEEQGDSTVFQSAPFLQPLLRLVGAPADARPHLVFVQDPLGPLLALPLVKRRKGRVDVLEIADFGLSDYCAPLMAKRFDSADAAQWNEIWRAVRMRLPSADALAFEKMPGLVAGRSNPLTRLAGARPMQTETRQVQVDPLWLKTSVAREALSKRRRLERQNGAHFCIVTEPAQVDRYMDAMRALRRRRFEARGIRDSLEEPGVFEFYRGLLREGCAAGRAVLGVQVCGDKPVAISAALTHRGRFNGVLTAMDEDARAFSPGLVSMVGLFEWCLEQKISVFDLGFGDQHYKARFGGERSMLHDWTQAQTAKGAVWKLAREARAAARRVIRHYPTLAAHLPRPGKSG